MLLSRNPRLTDQLPKEYTHKSSDIGSGLARVRVSRFFISESSAARIGGSATV
jgi:hypothetical protein